MKRVAAGGWLRVLEIGVYVLTALFGLAGNFLVNTIKADFFISHRWQIWVAGAALGLFAVIVFRIERILRDRIEAERQPLAGLDEPEVNARSRQNLISIMRHYWVRQTLDCSLHRIARLDLGLEDDDRAVHRPPELTIQTGGNSPNSLSPEVGLGEVLAERRSLLVLGSAGAGKTILLAELTRDLLTIAESSETTRAPVSLSLATWGERRLPLVDWIVAALATSVPGSTLRRWIERGRMVLLLDGLDEVAPEYREDCVAALNTFHASAPLVPLVVSCRREDYQQLVGRLDLHSAVVIQPLARSVVDAAIEQARDKLAALRSVLDRIPELYNVLDSPLMLDVAMIAYCKTKPAELIDTSTRSELERHLFNGYVRRMLDKHISGTGPSSESMTRTLAWVASMLKRHHQTYFALTNLVQFTWLPTPELERSVARATGFGVGAFTGFALGSTWGYLGHRIAPFFPVYIGIAAAIAGGLVGGLCGGPLTAILIMAWGGIWTFFVDLMQAFPESLNRPVHLAVRLIHWTRRIIWYILGLCAVAVVATCARLFPVGAVLGLVLGSVIALVLIWPSVRFAQTGSREIGLSELCRTLTEQTIKERGFKSASAPTVPTKTNGPRFKSWKTRLGEGALYLVLQTCLLVLKIVLPVQELAVRWYLYRRHFAPLAHAAFVRVAVARAFLTTAFLSGSDFGYRFVHPLLIEYFAGSPDFETRSEEPKSTP